MLARLVATRTKATDLGCLASRVKPTSLSSVTLSFQRHNSLQKSRLFIHVVHPHKGRVPGSLTVRCPLILSWQGFG